MRGEIRVQSRLIIFFPTISFETKLVFYSRKQKGESALVGVIVR